MASLSYDTLLTNSVLLAKGANGILANPNVRFAGNSLGGVHYASIV